MEGTFEPTAVCEYRLLHAELVEPSEMMQSNSNVASTFIFAMGAVPVDEGKPGPGIAPVAMFARLASVPAARVIPDRFELVAPILPPVAMNWLNA